MMCERMYRFRSIRIINLIENVSRGSLFFYNFQYRRGHYCPWWICAGGQSHCFGGASLTSCSQGRQPNILRARISSFSACTISSSTCPQPIFASMSFMLGVYKGRNWSLKAFTESSIESLPKGRFCFSRWPKLPCVSYRKCQRASSAQHWWSYCTGHPGCDGDSWQRPVQSIRSPGNIVGINMGVILCWENMFRNII